MADIAIQQQSKPALFSTNLGEFAPRAAIGPLPPVILHSNIQEDKVRFASALRQKYPTQCGAILPTFALEDYFDAYDIHLQTPVYLALVLQEILAQNIARATTIHNFAIDWSHANREKIATLGPDTSDLQDVFSAGDQEHFGADFLNDALVVLKVQKARSSSVDPFSATRKPDRGRNFAAEIPMPGEFTGTSTRYPISSSSYSSMVQAHRYSSAPDLSHRGGPASLNRPSLGRYQSVQNEYVTLGSAPTVTSEENSASCSFPTGHPSYLQQDPSGAHISKPYVAGETSLRPAHFANENQDIQAVDSAQQDLFLYDQSFLKGLPLLSQHGTNRNHNYSHGHVKPTSIIARAMPLGTPRSRMEPNLRSTMSPGGNGGDRYSMNAAGKGVHNMSMPNVERGPNILVQAVGNNPLGAEPYVADFDRRSSRPYHNQYLPNPSAPPLENSFQDMLYPQVRGVRASHVQMDSPDRDIGIGGFPGYDRQGRVCIERLPSIEVTTADLIYQDREPSLPATDSIHNKSHAWHTQPSNQNLTDISNGTGANKTSPTKHRKGGAPFQRVNASIPRTSIPRINHHASQVQNAKRASEPLGQVLANPLDRQYQNENSMVHNASHHTLNAFGKAATGVSRKLFVGNIPVALTEGDLRNLFSRYGHIEYLTLKEYQSQEEPLPTSKFAFIQFCTLPEALQALENMRGYALDGRALRVNFARPQGYPEDRALSSKAGLQTQLSAEGLNKAKSISVASPQGKFLTAKANSNPRTVDGVSPSTRSTPIHLYQSSITYQPDGNGSREQAHNTSSSATFEPSVIQLRHRAAAASNLKHPYGHFYSGANLNGWDSSGTFPQTTELPTDHNDSASLSFHTNQLFPVPKDLLDRDRLTYGTGVAQATDQPSRWPELLIGGDPFNHVGQIDGKSEINMLPRSGGHHDQDHGSVMGVPGASDRLSIFSPQDARSDFPGPNSTPIVNTIGPGVAEALTPSHEIGANCGAIREGENDIEGPPIDGSRIKSSALYRGGSETTQILKADQEASPKVHSRKSPEKRMGSRKISSKNNSPIKSRTGAQPELQSRDASVSRQIGIHAVLSQSPRNPTCFDEVIQTVHQSTKNAKDSSQGPSDEPLYAAADANSDASKVDKIDVVATYATMQPSGHAPLVEEAVKTVPKPDVRLGNAQGQTTQSPERSLSKSMTPSVSKVKKTSKAKKKKATNTGTQLQGGQVVQLVKGAAIKDSPADMIQRHSPNKPFQEEPLVSRSPVNSKRPSTAAVPPTIVEADYTTYSGEIIPGLYSHESIQGGPGDSMSKERGAAVTDVGLMVRPRALFLGPLSDSVASKQIGGSTFSGAEAIESGNGNTTMSHPSTSLDQVLAKPTVGDKKAFKGVELSNLSTSNPKAKKKATGQPQVNQSKSEHNLKRSVPNSQSISPGKKVIGEADATNTSSCSAPDLNSRSSFPDLGVVNPGKAKHEHVEEAAPARPLQPLQVCMNNKGSVELNTVESAQGRHTQNTAPSGNIVGGAQSLGHRKAASRDVVDLNDTQSNIVQTAANNTSQNGEGGVIKAQPAKPPTWSEVVGRSASSSQNQKQAGTGPEPQINIIDDPWAIDEGAAAWGGKVTNKENNPVDCTKNQNLQGKDAPKLDKAKGDIPGTNSTRKRNANSMGKKAHDTSSQLPVGKRKGGQKERVVADAWAKSWDNGFVGRS
ncbi:MAG: hypothetical protein M1812_005104 [Candelaria pacifica]|nr:MAG: hypothetical protein M1812_005104 [Candelaria pacifica]